MISQNSIQKILGITEKVHVTPEDMSTQMVVSFYPDGDRDVSENIKNATTLLRQKLQKFGVKEIPYADIFTKVPFNKRLKRFSRFCLNNILYILTSVFKKPTRFFIDFQTIKSLSAKYKYKTGVCVIVSGELKTKDLPMQFIKSFKDNSIIYVLDFPKDINEESTFEHHFDKSMSLFAYNMANIVLAVDDQKWMIYNFNASHPIFNFKDDSKLDYYVLNGLIPKVVAPISPHKMKDFIILKDRFDNDEYKNQIEDLKHGGELYSKTNLFPVGKKIDDLGFRNNFHRQIGKIHLDSRNGMSFGFIAKQLPINSVSQIKELSIDEKNNLYSESDFRFSENNLYIVFEIKGVFLEIKLPEVWVLTLRSGADKTHFNPDADLLKMGIKNGTMLMQVGKNTKINNDYKPSFDTKVILAHAVGNAIAASVFEYFGINNNFVENIKKDGCSISHWHGYFKEDMIPENVIQYGKEKPHVACSSPQSAIYALDGKLRMIRKVVEEKLLFVGDIHVEPHHGSNICYPKLTKLVEYILNHEDSVSLGNKYL